MFGDGPIDLVLIPGAISHLEHNWTIASRTAWLRRLGTLARVVTFDKRGTGLSDRVGRVLTLEERADDIRAVMDAAEFERAVIFGISDGGSLAAFFAAIYPERTIGLMIYAGLASYVARPDYPWPPTHDEYRRHIEELEETLHERWGTLQLATEDIELMAPSGANDPELIAWAAGLMRLGGSPGAEIARRKMNLELDVRGILPTISVPSIVLHRVGEADVKIEEGRYIATHIPGCGLVELPGTDHFEHVGEQAPMFAAIETFLGGLAPDRDGAASGQKFATVLCLDMPLGAPRLTTAICETVRATIDEYGGKTVDQGPRNLIAHFDGSIRAMRCAWSLIQLLRAHAPAGRIGIHSGPIEPGITTFGATGVAIQLASMTESGSVIVTESVRNISSGAGLLLETLGEQTFAGIETPLEVFLVSGSAPE